MEAPDYLNATQRAIWEDYAKTFPSLVDEDPELLAAYAQAAGNVVDMQRIISAEGLTVPNSRGNPSAHPLLNVMRGYNRERASLAEKIRKRHKPVGEGTDRFA